MNTSQELVHRRKISITRTKKPTNTLPDEAPQDQETMNDRSHLKSRLLFNSMFQEYERILVSFKVSHNNLTIQTLEALLIQMNYFPRQRHDSLSTNLKQIYDILSCPESGVTITNLFKFMLIVDNINYSDAWFGNQTISVVEKDERLKPIGTFNNEGDWHLEDHEKLGIRKIFQSLHYNRLSGYRTRTRVQSIDLQCKFSPQILNKSRILAQKQRQRIKSFSKKNLLSSSSHQELLIICKKVTAEKVKQSAEKLQKQEKIRCPFKPKTNYRKKSVQQPKDRCLHLFNRSKQISVSQYLPSNQQKQNKIFEQCTFHPASTSSNIKLSCIPLAKNSKSSIQRMKKGSHNREMDKTLKQRGYPAGTNWNKFFNQYKKDVQYDPKRVKTHGSSIVSKDPIMNIQVDFSGNDQSIQVFEGDSVQNLACKILVKNNLPSNYLESVEKILYQEVEKNKRVSIHNGFLYQLN